MKNLRFDKSSLLPAALIVVALATLAVWLASGPGKPLGLRVPGTDNAPGGSSDSKANPVLVGTLINSNGQPAALPGAWPCFRGSNHDAISSEPVTLARSWPSSGPQQLWAIDAGEGYAGAAVLKGRVYLMDYDRDKRQDALRCLSLADGREIWRYAYPVPIKRNHGMSRTVPAVKDKLVVAIGPKCHVVCLDSTSGQLKWGMDLVRQYGTSIPQWYAGQCPLLDGENIILAPGGRDALVMAVQGETGKELWRSPNTHGWKMTHSSVMPMDFEGERTYVYCANKGVVGVSAKDGSQLWETADWKISLATVPSPLVLDHGRIFLTGGYNAGSIMLQVRKENGRLNVHTLFKIPSEVFGATQHTPIAYENHIYGTRADGKFVCLDFDGKVVWTSTGGVNLGLGSFLLANGSIFAMSDSGQLRLVEAIPTKYNLLAEAQVLNGRESWAPLALAGGRLIARDLTRMICLDVSADKK